MLWLHRSEKLAALGQVAAGVAHELGAPLSLIDGKAQRALRHPEHPAATPLNGIREQVRRMERLVRQLLEFGRPASPVTRFEPRKRPKKPKSWPRPGTRTWS
jgi:two-component system, NtrC family, sensor kinase